MADAIIVLARGINLDGSLPPDPCSRVRRAAAMKGYAIKLGVKAADIVEDTKSKDTLGNVYFTKKDICEPNGWRELMVVASDEHMPRVQYLFKKLYGPLYRIVYEVSDRVIDDDKYISESKHELESLIATKKALDYIKDGDDKTIGEIMRAKHPAYS
jgi:uncharacterized SAM-binding protein YcdF (DUF218 family)